MRVELSPSGKTFQVEGNDSLLEAALSAGLRLNYGCSNGNCGLCRARLVAGQVKTIRHSDFRFSDADRAQDFFLMCASGPESDLVIEAQEAASDADIPHQRVLTKLKQVTPLSETVSQVHLQTPRSHRLRFLAGQSLRLTDPNGAAMTLPIASCPCDDRNIQFHVDTTQPSTQLLCSLPPHTSLEVDGPLGDFILDDDSRSAHIFVACDLGFAPVKSLVEHAFSLWADQELTVLWLAQSSVGHYAERLLKSWSDAFENFRFELIEKSGAHEEPSPDSGLSTPFRAALARACEQNATVDVYVAGPGPLANWLPNELTALPEIHRLRATEV